MKWLRRVLTVGAAWSVLWLGFWVGLVTLIAIVKSGSVDPGEPWAMLTVFAPMGVLSGVAFGALMTARAGRTPMQPPALQAVLSGTLATAIVQLAYLDHGDRGLAHNLHQALLLSVASGIVSAGWLAAARMWRRVA